MKTIEKINQEWEAMLSRGKMPLFELELKNDEYLLVDLELFPELEEIRFSFDSMELKTWFSGNVKTIHDCKFAIDLTEYDCSLDSVLELIYEEIIQGFICPNDLFPKDE